MKIKAIFAASLLTLGAGLGAVPPAMAAPDKGSQDQVETQAAQAAKVSLTDAVNAARAQAKGKAMEVVFSRENGHPGYEVTLVAPGGSEKNLFVTADTGKVSQDTAVANNEHDDNGAHGYSEEKE